jgi:hypothetical protein
MQQRASDYCTHRERATGERRCDAGGPTSAERTPGCGGHHKKALFPRPCDVRDARHTEVFSLAVRPLFMVHRAIVPGHGGSQCGD